MAVRSRWAAAAAIAVGVLLLLAGAADGARYRYLSYGGVNRRLRLLAAAHGDVLRVYRADRVLGVARAGLCRSSAALRPAGRPDEPCETLVADIGPRSAPAVLVLGSLHGDERLGAVAALALVEALATQDADEWLARLARSRRVVVVPMPNPSAYDKFSRFEPGPNGTLLDAASDFPFARSGGARDAPAAACLRTTAARVVHALFARHLFRVAVALHARREFIGYSWGSDRREFCALPPAASAAAARNASAAAAAPPPPDALPRTGRAAAGASGGAPDYEDDDGDPDCAGGWAAPDAAMLRDVAGRMAAFAGAAPGGARYAVGALNDPRVAGPVSGGFADYAYAASFRPDLVAACGGAHGGDAGGVSAASHRAAALIFEASLAAAPPERALGSPRALYDAARGGVIPRALRALLLAVDVAQPYAFFTAERRPRVGRGGVLRAQWSVGGAVTVDRTYLRMAIGGGAGAIPFQSANQSGASMWGQPFDAEAAGADPADSLFDRIRRRRRVDRFVYDDAVLLYRYLTPHQRRHGARLSVQAVAHVDSAWGVAPANATGARAPVSPAFEGGSGEAQSHLARSRSDPDWHVEHAGVRMGYEGVVVSEPLELSVPPLSGWLVWRDLAFVSILLCVLPPAVLLSCFRRGGKIAVGPSSRSLARLRLRQLRKAQGWFNSSKSAIVADIAEMQRLRGRAGDAP